LKKLNFFKLWKSRINSVEEYFAIFAWILFHMEIVCAFFIDIVVWGILFPWAMVYDHKNHTHTQRDNLINVVSISCHAINFVMMAIEFALNRVPFHFHHLSFIWLWACCYSLFQWIFFFSGAVVEATHSPWVYPFMNLCKKTAVVWYLFFFVLLGVFFGVTLLIHYKFKSRHCTLEEIPTEKQTPETPLINGETSD